MKAVRPSRLRAAEARAVGAGAVSAGTMMRRAGAGLAREVAVAARAAGLGGCGVAVYCGVGNNGGDGMAAATYLAADGFKPVIFLAGREERMGQEARAWHTRALRKGIEVVGVRAGEEWVGPPLPVAVDALLGTGAVGAVRGAVRACVLFLGGVWGRPRLVVAADTPTGLDGEGGCVGGEGLFVKADLTVTMGRPKPVMATALGRAVCGSIRVVGIGLPEAYIREAEEGDGVEVITREDAAPWLGRRVAESSKGDYGRAFLAVGSGIYPGAGVLAAAGAARSGVGLVRVKVGDRERAAVLGGVVPSVIVNDGMPDEGVCAMLVGSGMDGATARGVLGAVLEAAPAGAALVLDAGALGNVGEAPLAGGMGGREVVLTPHLGELARLGGVGVGEAAADPVGLARGVARRLGAVVVVKGNCTAVVAADGRVAVNLTGNAGMANGGSGDVLAGFLTGLLARRVAGSDAFGAAKAAVYLHGVAGDLASFRFGQNGMNAWDLVGFLSA